RDALRADGTREFPDLAAGRPPAAAGRGADAAAQGRRVRSPFAKGADEPHVQREPEAGSGITRGRSGEGGRHGWRANGALDCRFRGDSGSTPYLSKSGEEVEGEEVFGVGPGCRGDEAGRGRGGLELFYRKLVGVLGDDDLAGAEGEGAAADMHGLRPKALDADRHAARSFLVDGAVTEGG